MSDNVRTSAIEAVREYLRSDPERCMPTCRVGCPCDGGQEDRATGAGDAAEEIVDIVIEKIVASLGGGELVQVASLLPAPVPMPKPSSVPHVTPSHVPELSIEFLVTLIKLVEEPTANHRAELNANCTHVSGPYWIMEGDIEYLRRKGVRFDAVEEGVVGPLGDFSEDQLKRVCYERFGVRI